MAGFQALALIGIQRRSAPKVLEKIRVNAGSALENLKSISKYQRLEVTIPGACRSSFFMCA